MDVIDAKWIENHLTGRYGEKADLARAAGLTPKQLSYILAGSRAVSQEEAVKIREFFGRIERPSEMQGFSESTATAFTPAPNSFAAQILVAAQLHGRHPATYRSSAQVAGASLAGGDVAIIDLKQPAQDGDLVVCSITDMDHDVTTTHFRRLHSPWLVDGVQSVKMDDDDMAIRIHGPVIAIINATMLRDTPI